MATLGDYITIKHGYAFKGTGITTEDNGVVLVTPGNFAIGGGFKEEKCKFFNGKYPAEYVLSPDDLIVTMTDLSKDMDTLGYSALVPFSGRTYLHNQRIGLINIKEESVDKHYLYWFMRTHKYQRTIAGGASGTTVHHTSPARICEIEVDFPDIETQRSIAMILGAIDDKIAINQQINKNLEEQAQVIYKAWFVDFEPFGGEMPADWRYYQLSEFLPVVTGKKNANVSSDKGVYPFFSCSQDIAWTDEYSFEGNAILVAGNGDFNVKFYNGKFEAYQRTYVLIPRNPIYTAWLYHAIKYSLNIITMAARGSVIKFITKGNLEEFSFAAPVNLADMELIPKFHSINEMIERNRKENLTLSTMRDALLPRLMSGEIDVARVEIEI